MYAHTHTDARTYIYIDVYPLCVSIGNGAPLQECSDSPQHGDVLVNTGGASRRVARRGGWVWVSLEVRLVLGAHQVSAWRHECDCIVVLVLGNAMAA